MKNNHCINLSNALQETDYEDCLKVIIYGIESDYILIQIYINDDRNLMSKFKTI